MSTAAEIKDALRCGAYGCACRTRGNSHCPAPGHGDSSPSLSVKEGDRADVVVYCRTRLRPAGCNRCALTTRALGVGADDATTNAELEPRQGVAVPERRQRAVAYHGREEDGHGNKHVRWRLPDGAYDAGLKSQALEQQLATTRTCLRRAPLRSVYFVSEVAADEGTSRDLLAVSLCGGAAQQDFGQALDALAGRIIFSSAGTTMNRGGR